jgi:hypothetical protein
MPWNIYGPIARPRPLQRPSLEPERSWHPLTSSWPPDLSALRAALFPQVYTLGRQTMTDEEFGEDVTTPVMENLVFLEGSLDFSWVCVDLDLDSDIVKG